MPQALFTTSFPLLQGVMDVTLRREGKLPSELAIATFGDNELLDFLQCPVLAVAQRHRDVAERVLEIVLASLSGVCLARGMDCPPIREVCASRSSPDIVSGGCGGPGDAAAAAQAGASAVAVASILHYKKTTVPQLKAGIREHGIEVR